MRSSHSQSAQGAVDEYLEDLRRLLLSAPSDERDEIVSAVREHVEESLARLGRPATMEDASQIIASLGPAEYVATTWALQTSGDVASEPRRSVAAWGALLLAVLSVCSLLISPFLALTLSVAALVTGLSGARRHRANRVLYQFTAGVGALGLVASLAYMGLLLAADTQTVDTGPAQVVEP